jgi:hypothetical protein
VPSRAKPPTHLIASNSTWRLWPIGLQASVLSYRLLFSEEIWSRGRTGPGVPLARAPLPLILDTGRRDPLSQRYDIRLCKAKDVFMALIVCVVCSIWHWIWYLFVCWQRLWIRFSRFASGSWNALSAMISDSPQSERMSS